MKWPKKKQRPNTETPPRQKPKNPEGYGVCKYCLIKNGHAGWCPMIS